MAWVDQIDSGSHFLHFNLYNVLGYINVAWGSVWVAIINEISRHRNKHIFKGGTIDHCEIFSLTQLKAWSWITSYFAYACFFPFLIGVLMRCLVCF